MKKETEKQPIDDLFARKMSNMSLPPSPDGFERLQKRINQDKPDERIIFWRNSSVQWYMAVAACLILVGLFGWLQWQPNAQTMLGGSVVATKYTLPRYSQKQMENQSNQPNSVVANKQKEDGQLALVEETTVNKKKGLSTAQSDDIRKPVLHHHSIQNEPVLTQAEPAKAQVDPEDTRVQNTPQINNVATEQVAASPVTVKLSSPTERVLIVTIEEPASLVAARQTAQKFVEEKPTLTINDKDEKETKSGVWNQVRRFKEGELFARHNDGTTGERGLLDRAYNSLKHSIDKNKQAKQ